MGTCFTQVDPDSEFGDRDDNGRQQGKRQCTNVFFLYFMGVFIAIVTGFMTYCASIGDVNRILHGYDNCGNVCGKQNSIIGGSHPRCFGVDMTAKPYLMEKRFDGTIVPDKRCVISCEKYGYATILGSCIPQHTENEFTTKHWFQQFVEDVSVTKIEIFYMSFVSLALVALTVMLLRYRTESFVWAMLIGGFVALILLCVGLWIARGQATTEVIRDAFLILAIIATVFVSVLILCFLVMFKRIKMVVALFKEASKAIGAVPHLLLEPIVTILAFFVSFAVVIYGSILIGSAGSLVKMRNVNGFYEYMPNNAVVFATVIFAAGWIWMLHFFAGCQNMIVAGTISSWYFARDKTRLVSPMLSSTSNLLRFHLGTIAFGSLVILIMQLVRMAIGGLKRAAYGSGNCMICCCCIFSMLEDFMGYFSTLAYIMTSIHGVPFCVGGKTAMRLIVKNGLSTIALTSVGSFILIFIDLVIMLTTMLIGYFMMDKPGLNSVWWPVLLSVFIAGFMTYCILSVYDTTLDTIFLCFCEDSEQNDGLSRPYFMSAELRLIVENSKKALEQLEPGKENKANKRSCNA